MLLHFPSELGLKVTKNNFNFAHIDGIRLAKKVALSWNTQTQINIKFKRKTEKLQTVIVGGKSRNIATIL